MNLSLRSMYQISDDLRYVSLLNDFMFCGVPVGLVEHIKYCPRDGKQLCIFCKQCCDTPLFFSYI